MNQWVLVQCLTIVYICILHTYIYNWYKNPHDYPMNPPSAEVQSLLQLHAHGHGSGSSLSVVQWMLLEIPRTCHEAFRLVMGVPLHRWMVYFMEIFHGNSIHGWWRRLRGTSILGNLHLWRLFFLGNPRRKCRTWPTQKGGCSTATFDDTGSWEPI